MQKRVTIDGAEYGIDQLGAKDALRCALVAGRWKGEVIAKAGAAETEQAGIGASIAAFCTMLLSQEYVEACFLPLLSVCTHADGRRVKESWELDFRGDKLASLLKLHNEALNHNCGAFLAGLAGGMTGFLRPPTTTAT